MIGLPGPPAASERIDLKDVFISYAREDSDTARQLASLLEAAGLSVWWDPQLRVGQDFALEIDRVLQQIRCVLVLWSADSVDSHWVRSEASEGLRLGKLVPVALDNSTPPLVFRALHTLAIDISDLDTDNPAVRKLIDDIRTLIGTESSVTTDAMSAPAKPALPWRKLAGIGGAVIALLAFMAFSGLPALLLDGLTGWSGAGVGLDPITTETALLSIALLLLLVASWQLHIRRYRSRLWSTLIALAALMLTTCIYTWGERWIAPAPNSLRGIVISSEWFDMQASAIGAVNRSAPLGEIPVSTENGEFEMALQTGLADRPRLLRISKPGCADHTTAIGWRQWQAQQPIEVEFRCLP